MPPESGSPRLLRFDEVGDILRLAGREAPGVTLIGGQALNYWAGYYEAASPQLRAGAPYGSGDIDFLGSMSVAERLARELPGRLERTGIYGPRVTMAAISYRGSDNEPRLIHFLGDMAGVSPAEVVKTSIVLEGHLRVMHPLLCMESRVANVLELKEYDTPHAHKQALASIECAAAYVRELMTMGDVDGVLGANERIYRLAKQRAAGCARRGFAPFSAVLLDERLPEKFRTIRYPQMSKALGHELSLDRSIER